MARADEVTADGPTDSWISTNKVNAFLDRSSVRPIDFPKVIVLWEALKWSLGLGIMGACIRYRPLEAAMRHPGPRRWRDSLKQRHPKWYNATETRVMSTANKLGALRWVQPVPKWLGVQPTDFVLGIGEGFLCYKALWIFHAPPLLYVSVAAFQDEGRQATLALQAEAEAQAAMAEAEAEAEVDANANANANAVVPAEVAMIN
jgi:hypothetical protein